MVATTLIAGISVAKILLLITEHDTAVAISNEAETGTKALLHYLRLPKGPASLGRQVSITLDEFLNNEFPKAETNDIQAAVDAVDQLLRAQAKSQSLEIEALLNPKRLLEKILADGGEVSSRNLGGISSEIFDFLLKKCIEQIQILAPNSTGFKEKSLAHILGETQKTAEKLDKLFSLSTAGICHASEADSYLEQVKAVAPPALIDRESELGQVTNFTLNSLARWIGFEAPAQSGKSALLSSFALTPPRGVAVVAFIIDKHDARARDRREFLTAVLPQLARLAKRETVALPTFSATQECYVLKELLCEAAANCLAGDSPKQLLLIIDGLDEDAYYTETGMSRGSIIALLPGDLPEGVKVLTSRRTNPPLPADLPRPSGGISHPLQQESTWHQLSVSPHAIAAFHNSDIDELMSREPGRSVAGFLAAAEAPLTVNELASLAKSASIETNNATIRQLLNSQPGRLFSAHPVNGNAKIKAYKLGHDLVHQKIISNLQETDLTLPNPDETDRWDQLSHSVLKSQRKLIKAWADSYNNAHWPEDTPNYLLDDSYINMLRRDAVNCSDSRSHLVSILIDRHRIRAIHSKFDTVTAALQQIRRAISWLIHDVDQNSIDIQNLSDLVLLDEQLTNQGKNFPVALPAVFASLGHTELAYSCVGIISHPVQRAMALAKIASRFAATGNVQAQSAFVRAKAAAELISGSPGSGDVLSELALITFMAPQALQAETLVSQEPSDSLFPQDSSVQVRGLVNIATFFSKTENDSGALIAASKALLLDRRFAGKGLSPFALAKLAKTFAGTANSAWMLNEIATALVASEEITDPSEQAYAKAEISLAFSAFDDSRTIEIAAQALNTVIRISKLGLRIKALAKISAAFAALDDPRAIEAANQALKAATQINTSPEKVRMLTLVANTYVNLGLTQEAVKTARIALHVSARSADPFWRMRTLVEISVTYATAGNRSPFDIIEQISEPSEQERALVKVATAFASVGDARAFDTIELIRDPFEKERALARVATTFASIGDARAFDTIELIRDPSEKVRALTSVSAALSGTDDESARDASAQAVLVAENIINPFWQASAFVGVASSFLQMNALNLAIEAITQSMNAAKELIDPLLRARIYLDIGLVCIDAGDNRATQVIDLALRAARSIVSPSDRARITAEVAPALAMLNDSKALVIAEAISRQGERSKAYAAIAIAFATASDSRSLEVLDNCESSVEKARSLVKIFEIFLSRHDPSANETSIAALELVQNLDSASERVRLLMRLASAFASVGDIRATETVTLALADSEGCDWALISPIDGGKSIEPAQCLNSIAQQFIDAGKASEARKLAGIVWEKKHAKALELTPWIVKDETVGIEVITDLTYFDVAEIVPE